jgi:hypothetical protein
MSVTRIAVEIWRVAEREEIAGARTAVVTGAGETHRREVTREKKEAIVCMARR